MEMTEYRLLNVVRYTDNEVKARQLEALGFKKVEKEDKKATVKKQPAKKEG
jgi:hypothetical protein